MKSILLVLMLLISTATFAQISKTINLTKKNHINFNQGFTGDFVALKQLELLMLAAESDEQDLYVVLYTPGGSVSAGNLFIDTAMALNKNIHTITIFAASMGYNTVQQLGNRYIIPSGILMSHRASLSGLSGQFPGELNARMDMYMSMTGELSSNAAKRVGLTQPEYEKLIHDEFWTIGQAAVESGHADQVIYATCDPELLTTSISTQMTFFGPVSVEKSNCPLIVSPLNVQGSNEAVEFYKANNILNVESKIKASF